MDKFFLECTFLFRKKGKYRIVYPYEKSGSATNDVVSLLAVSIDASLNMESATAKCMWFNTHHKKCLSLSL